MEGIWFMWISWIITTFYLKKSKIRTWLAFWLLAIIVVYSKTIPVAMYEVSLAYLLVTLLCYWLISKYKFFTILYTLFVSMVITFLFAGLHLVELYDPVMFLIIDKMWVIATLVAIITIVLVKDFRGRLVVSISGLVQGELLFKQFLTTIYGIQPLGTGNFFDIIAISCAFIISWHIFEQFCEIMSQYVRKLPSSRGKDIRVFR
ncbi:hypothetical protein [Alkalihalobacterium alkalinitrilicum]|uniref:YphA family membrane protein n=1 Tax=Alkalihalobacterium alkalinitrilicum TaxID=427920 RepID=UPI000995251E|nr:hypothetical protein [Alkalihalobacterium alkalinitrilicum]